MAMFYIDDYISYNSFRKITGVSWEISADKEFTKLISSTYNNKNAINGWYTPLKRLDTDGYYGEFDTLFSRCKIHTEIYGKDNTSEWFVKELNTGIVKSVLIKRKDKVIGEIAEYKDGTYKILW